MERIRDNIQRLRDAAEAKYVLHGTTGKLTFLAATKGVSAEEINFAAQCGITDIGENRVQELMSKLPLLNPGLNIHFIGKLQTNKVKYIIDKVTLIHSVDSVRLATEINRQAAKKNIVMDVLLEVNIGEEESKSGVSPKVLQQLGLDVADMANIRVRGLMTMAPNCDCADEYKKYFSKMYEIFLDFFEKKAHNVKSSLKGGEEISLPPLLSMGMSDSYITAIQCGANIVRVGSAIFA